MPYSSVSDVPTYVPKAKRKQWLEVFNSAWKKAKSEGKSDKQAEESAFAQANGVAGPNSKKKADEPVDFVKFGTKLTGFTEGVYGPFQCGTCKFSKQLLKEHICVNMFVADDKAVPEDEFGNKLIEGEDCCNYWEATNEKIQEVHE